MRQSTYRRAQRPSDKPQSLLQDIEPGPVSFSFIVAPGDHEVPVTLQARESRLVPVLACLASGQGNLHAFSGSFWGCGLSLVLRPRGNGM
eukprot:4879047-Amphidinium_carterae.1